MPFKHRATQLNTFICITHSALNCLDAALENGGMDEKFHIPMPPSLPTFPR